MQAVDSSIAPAAAKSWRSAVNVAFLTNALFRVCNLRLVNPMNAAMT
jgi:hypothetical protein